MSDVYVHYFVDGRYGTVDLHFSGSKQYHAPIRNTAMFTITVDQIKKIPTGKRNYDKVSFVWTLDSDYWDKVFPFFQTGQGHIYELISYKFESDWQAFLAGLVELPENGKKKIDINAPDHIKAQSFFNNFNQVIEATASAKTDKEVLAQLLGISSLKELDGANPKALKTIYRDTAIRLHPDKNNGDHHQMATFTQLWGIYVQPK